MKKKSFLLAHLKTQWKKYAGQYVAVIDGKVVTSGYDRVKVYKLATQGISPHKEIGIYYIPRKEDLLTAL